MIVKWLSVLIAATLLASSAAAQNPEMTRVLFCRNESATLEILIPSTIAPFPDEMAANSTVEGVWRLEMHPDVQKPPFVDRVQLRMSADRGSVIATRSTFIYPPIPVNGGLVNLDTKWLYGSQCSPFGRIDHTQRAAPVRCNAGQIAVRGSCRPLDLESASARVLEIKRTARSHCHAMAEIYDELSRATRPDSQRLSYYVWKLLGAGSEVSPYYVEFTDDGFLPQFKDKSPQVRHFSAYFSAAVTFPGTQLYGEIYTQIQDFGEPADRALARVALALGRQARASQQQTRHLGEAIRSQVCVR